MNCRFETYRGVAFCVGGNNTNEIYFTNTKFESLVSSHPALRISEAAAIYLDAVQIYTKGTSGTLPTQVAICKSKCVAGTMFLEHSAEGVELASFVHITQSAAIDLCVLVYGGESRLTGSYCAVVDGASNSTTSIRGWVLPSSGNKLLSSQPQPFRVPGMAIERRGEPHLQFRNTAANGGADAWSLGRLSHDGSGSQFRLLHANPEALGGGESVIFICNVKNDFTLYQNLFMSGKAFHPAQIASAPFGREGSLYTDNSNEATAGITTWRVMLNGDWRRIGYASAAPTEGAWRAGDILYNIAPAAGGYVGWVCVAAGSPGTWRGFGAIAS
jgi:hypothetical protein